MFGMKRIFFLSMFVTSIFLANHAGANKGTLTKVDVKIGVGKEAIAGKKVSVHYTGWLLDDSAPRECSELPIFVSLKRVLSCLENKGNFFIFVVQFLTCN